MKKLVVSATALILLFSSSSALFMWSDSTPDDVRSDFSPTDYCQSQDISEENFESFCVEVGSDWNNVVLSGDGFEGLDNILTLTRKALNNDREREDGDLTFAETNMILSLTSCESSGVETVGDCIEERGSSFGLNPDKLLEPAELHVTEDSGSDSGSDDSEEDTSNGDADNEGDTGSDSSDSDSDGSESSDKEIMESSSNLGDPHGDWTYEGSVEPDRYGVNDEGKMVLEYSGCGKVYYESEYESGAAKELDVDFQAENWEGMVGVWYTDSSGNLDFKGRNVDSSDLSSSGSYKQDGTIEVTQGAAGPIQIGFSADISKCSNVGNAKMLVEEIK
ncbi:MAG: hypothetical protein ACI9LV_000081 [Candidatus Nanohaloarchaea archaeon]|jgi:hypothetical protein